MGTVARVTITRGHENWEACHPFGCTWGTPLFHNPSILKQHALSNFWAANATHDNQYDDAVVLVETDLGWP